MYHFEIITNIYIYIYIERERERERDLYNNNKGLFGFCVSITHSFVSITHNSKMVGPTERKLVWICFQVLLPSLNSLIFK